ncbi:MAG: flagellar protein FliJ [Thiomicrorhabdus sp.]|nr:MAG: flagellar protein FliJ [Thiomicrorhabdus sp.]
MSSRMDRVLKLIELAEIEMDKAAKTLGAVQEQHIQAQNQLVSLQTYEQEYSQAPAKESISMNIVQLQTRHTFGEKLHQAVMTQSFQVDEFAHTIERVKDNWLEKRTEVKSLQLLFDKLKRDREAQLNKQEQRLLDELAAQKMILDKKNR